MSVLDILSRSTYTKFADWCNNKEQMGKHESEKGCYCVINSLCVYSCAVCIKLQSFELCILNYAVYTQEK